MAETIETIIITLGREGGVSVKGKATGAKLEDGEVHRGEARRFRFRWRCECGEASDLRPDARLVMLDAAIHARAEHGAW